MLTRFDTIEINEPVLDPFLRFLARDLANHPPPQRLGLGRADLKGGGDEVLEDEAPEQRGDGRPGGHLEEGGEAGEARG